MRVIIVGNGDISDRSLIKNNYTQGDILICCDGGSKYFFEEGITPNYIIGDLDSSIPEVIKFFESKGVDIKKFDPKKDKTDMELCLDFAISLGAAEIILLGALGTRFDHSLSNIGILLNALYSNVSAKIINENSEIFIIDSFAEIHGESGQIVSLIPFSKDVEGVNTEGLEYELKDFKMTVGSSLGNSNVMLGNLARVSIEKGKLIIIKVKE